MQEMLKQKGSAKLIIKGLDKDIALTLYPFAEKYRVLKDKEPGIAVMYANTLEPLRNAWKQLKEAPQKPALETPAVNTPH